MEVLSPIFSITLFSLKRSDCTSTPLLQEAKNNIRAETQNIEILLFTIF